MRSRGARTPESAANTAAAVILVHGTGSANPEDAGTSWWQAGSDTWNSLNQLLTGRAVCGATAFHWSGLNSERERQNAAANLLDQVSALEDAKQPYHLVGHSHGGSVIWMALCEATRRRVQLEYLRSWATLGTPFLVFAPSRFPFLLLLPLTLAATAIGVFATGGTQSRLWQASPGLRPYVEYAGDHYGALIGLPFFWLVLLAVLGVLIAYVVGPLRSRRREKARRTTAKKCYTRYGSRYLGIWAPLDEAINGLATTLHLQGDVLPKWGPDRNTFWSAAISTIIWPIRRIYNAAFAPIGDDFVWDRVSKNLQGNDISAAELGLVARGPCFDFAAWPSLPSKINDELVADADQHLVETTAVLREAIGVTQSRVPDRRTSSPALHRN